MSNYEEFLDAVRNNNYKVVERITTNKRIPIPVLSDAINIARNNDYIVRLLGSKVGAQVNEFLIDAASKGYKKVVDLALNQGALDVGFAARAAAKNHQIDMVKYLESKIKKYYKEKEYVYFYHTILLGAIEGKHLDIVDYALKQGADKESALEAAIHEDNLPAVQYLLDNYEIEPTENSLIAAIAAVDPEIVSLLLKYGAVPTQKALELARAERDLAPRKVKAKFNEIIALLMEYGLVRIK